MSITNTKKFREIVVEPDPEDPFGMPYTISIPSKPVSTRASRNAHTPGARGSTDNNIQTITIPQTDIYYAGKYGPYFSYKMSYSSVNFVLRDILVDLEKNSRFVLEHFAKEFAIKNVKKIKKPELVKMLKDRIIFQ